MSAASPDWDLARDETIAHLQALIRLPTVNPPGNEIILARWLERVLVDVGIGTVVLEPAPTRAIVVARIRGTGARRPVMLLAHMDVVGVEREAWSMHPFGGEIRDGYLYGRGAIDDKGMLTANLEAMLLIQRHVIDAGHTLARDVVFVATSDEEIGGEFGIDWLVANRPELLDAEIALNEGGRTRVVDGRPLYFAVQTAEKVPHVVSMIARGPGGHASVPLAGNAIVRLGRALAAVGAHREPLQLTATSRRFFEGLRRVWPDARQRAAMADLVSADGSRAARGAAALDALPMLDALVRNGVSATIVEGGQAANVIPTHGSATLNIRTLPGESLDGVLARLACAIDDPLVELRVVARGEDASASPVDSPMFRALAESVRALDPTLAVVPYLSTGATDSAALRRHGIDAYGILPFPMLQEDEERMHGHDERIPLDALAFGTRVIHDAVVRVATDE